jgi:hypothetical protein
LKVSARPLIAVCLRLIPSVSSPIKEISVECPRCRRIYLDWDRASVDPEMAADRDYMRRVTTGTCPECGEVAQLGDLVREEVWRARPDPSGRRARPNPMATAVVIDAEDYVPFDHLSATQTVLRDEIRSAVGGLAATPEQVLHAVFCGEKPPRADVENLLLYNIGAAYLKYASQYGLRFEHSPGPRQGGARFSYRYELEDRRAEFSYWRPSRRLASWDWTDVGPLASERKVEQIWRALRSSHADVNAAARAPDAPFCVRAKIRPPIGRSAAPAAIVKSFLDGIICAFQADTDTMTATDVAEPFTKTMSTPIDEIRAMLLDPRQAVLGVVPKLVHARGSGVIWAPASDYCRAAELLIEPRTTDTWSISGVIDEIWVS